VSGKHAEEGESLVEKVEEFLHIGEHEPEAPVEGVEKAEPDVTEEFNPPAGWEPRTPPTDPDEEEKLRAAFGDPVKGVYAPHVEGPA
jgi:hypothetical protein